MKLLSITLACLIAAALVPMASTQLPHAATITKSQDRGLDRYTPKTIRGPAVAARAVTLRAKNKGVARAMRDLEKKGLRPALDQSVSLLEIRKTTISQNRTNRFVRASFQSETFSENGYEMTLFPYDDGNPSTWEGVVYERDPDGHEYEYTASFDISGEQETWDRIEETYYPWDGSEPVSSSEPAYYDGSYYPNDPMTPQQEQQISKINSIRGRSSYLMKANFAASPQRGFRPPGYPMPPHWQDRAKRWLRCSAASCTASAIACAFSGPGWGACFGGWCGGSAAGCIIATW